MWEGRSQNSLLMRSENYNNSNCTRRGRTILSTRHASKHIILIYLIEVSKIKNITCRGNSLVTGLPVNVKNSSLAQASARFPISCRPLIRLSVKTKFVIFGMLLFKFFRSMLSIEFPDKSKLLSRNSRGKFSRREIRLSVKSIVSKRSRVAPKCSIAGIASPLRTISRSPREFERCSDWEMMSAESLIGGVYGNTIAIACGVCVRPAHTSGNR